jgi:hypothetical protein
MSAGNAANAEGALLFHASALAQFPCPAKHFHQGCVEPVLPLLNGLS